MLTHRPHQVLWLEKPIPPWRTRLMENFKCVVLLLCLNLRVTLLFFTFRIIQIVLYLVLFLFVFLDVNITSYTL